MPPAPSSLPAVLDWHLRRYPLLQGRDIYKLIHQGVFGPGHAVASAAQARVALATELRALATQCKMQNAKCRMRKDGAEQPVEPIEPNGRLVRVNLRTLQKERREKSEERKRNPGKERRMDVDLLAMALVESARRVKGDPEQMRRRLAAAVRWCRKNLPRHVAELERIAAEAREAGYPAFHHSPAYRWAYQPAYRVILRTCLDSRVSFSRKDRTKREVRGEKLERRAGSDTSDI